MEKKYTMFLTVIAVATLLVTAAQASFAFSASTMQANIYTGDTVSKAVSSFTSDYDKGINITINNLDISNNNQERVLSDSSNVNVRLLAPEEGVLAKCTYDIIYVWNSKPQQDFEVSLSGVQDKYYIRTATVEKELTISAAGNIVNKDSLGFDTTSVITIPNVSETNIDAFDLYTKENTKLDYFYLVKGAVIASTSNVNPTEINWQFEVKFYNVNKDQAHLNGKSYNGYIMVDQDTIKC